MTEGSVHLRLISLVGLAVMIGLAWAFSENRRAADWRLVLWGLGLQLAVAVVLLRPDLLFLPRGMERIFFGWVQTVFDVITASSAEGAKMLFGGIARVVEMKAGPPGVGSEDYLISQVFAFQVIPMIIFVSALTAIAYHLHITQLFVRVAAWLMRRTLKTSGAETVGVALLIFLGIESTTAIRAYLRNMTRSELFTLMATFMATIAASVMVAYASFGATPGHLLAASLMSAPAAIVISKLMVPETGEPETRGHVRVELKVETTNLIDAASAGTAVGLQMALAVSAMLIVFIGLVYLLNFGCQTVLRHSFTELMGWFFRPFALLMGVSWADSAKVGELLGTKTVLNEFLAYMNLRALIDAGALSKRSVTIATYALCGFANPGSIGICVAALNAMIPERRREFVRLGFRSLVAGTLACFCTACIAGMLINE